MSVSKEQTWQENDTNEPALVLFVSEQSVFFQTSSSEYVKHLSKQEFIEQYQLGDSK